jgi:hypothetical protein
MNRKIIGIIMLISIAGAIIIGLILFNTVLMQESEEEPQEVEQPEIIDKISPYTNQGLIVEMLRIRDRDLMERMLVVGTSWRKQPAFYYRVTVDGKEGDVKGNVGETGIFTVWDTFGEESHISYYIEEEQAISEVTICIVEEVKQGLLGLRKNDVVQEEIRLTYDYRTGRWYGDDSLLDDDGYGHYLGDNFEIWFNIYQSDFDHDGIPYWKEINMLKTDPTVDDRLLDPDNDGIPTSWEYQWGYDPFTWDDHEHLDPDIDGIENIEEYQMRKWFANPFQPDIYIETDGMQKKGRFDVTHIFWKEAQQMIIERFAQHGINVYIDDGWPDGPVNGGGEMLPFHENLDDVVGKNGLSFYLHHFADERKGIFRYVVAGNKAGFIHPSEYNMMDTLIVGSNYKSILITRRAFTPRHVRVGFAKGVLHELGHSIGLVPITFPGNDIQRRRDGDRYPSMDDDEYQSYLEEYHSIMNYGYINNDRTLFDYSDGSNGPPYDQNDWEYIYLPSFQLDMISYEEPTDDSFEDFEVVNDYPGVLLDGWTYDENLTKTYERDFKDLVTMKNTDVSIQIYRRNDSGSGRNIRVYAMPNVYPTFAVWSLVAEGMVDNELTISFYSQETPFR